MENINLIRKIAWGFYYRTGIDFEELLSEATLAYLEANRTYDPCKEKGTLNYQQTFIKNRLINFCKVETRERSIGRLNSVMSQEYKETRHPFLEPGICNIQPFHCKNRTSGIPFFELYDSLSSPCKELTDIILSDPTRYVSQSSKQSRGLVVQSLREQGWVWERIWDSIREMKQILKQTPETTLQN